MSSSMNWSTKALSHEGKVNIVRQKFFLFHADNKNSIAMFDLISVY